MRRWVRVFLFFLIIPLAVLAVFPHIIRCQFIGYAPDFQRIAPGVYVSRDTPPRQRAFLLFEIRQAERRLASLWQSPRRGRAAVIFCQTPEQYERYCRGSEGAGCSLGTPWGDAWIVINPYGRNPDVLAHEMCHDELYQRLGWLTSQRQIPQWFNEGLALMLDHRFTTARDSLQRFRDYHDEWQYLTRGQQFVLELEEMESMRDFFGGGPQHVMLAYMTAGREVARWLSIVGRPGLQQLTDAVAAGNDFGTTYQTLEAKARQRAKKLR
ncbi:hypothetical protein [Tellurirhabdus rosea]|uniref:hypothetical protein n=1 Tax=Tellurirhabdus rosea TaxID=2674997 RepID=UPI00225A14D9|nr:hypothetical protein [Tellurirhabdus rosea]